ncbi:MAG: peptidylprolyl isomerase [Acidimicrobiia bacterium]
MAPTHVTRLSVLLAATALVAAACGDGDAPATGITSTTIARTTVTEVPLQQLRPPVDYAGFRDQPTACGGSQPQEITPQSFAAPDDVGLDAASMVVATITTSCGDIEVALDPSQAPATVNSFVFLARNGYFDGTVSHRIAPGFVVQMGDPTGTGSGGPGYALPDEFPPAGFAFTRGVLAMANAGAGTTGSQFFIMLEDAGLSPQFSVFGTVTGGLDVIDRIAAIPLGTSARGELSVPLETLYLERVTITAEGG